jgi:hypothetical protein
MAPLQPFKLALIAISLVACPLQAQGFSLSPMLLEQKKGIVQVTNRSNRSIQMDVQAFPIREVDGAPTAALAPFSKEDQDRLIRLRPHNARVRSNASRNISYQILDPSTSFYLCALTQTDTLLLRICSAWRASSP